MKQKLLIVGLSLMVALASASADATTYSYSHSGVQCAQAVSSMTNIERDQYGVHNTSLTDGLTVECPINFPTNSATAPTVSDFGMGVYDRNPSADVSCSMQGVDGNGNVYYTAALITSGSGAGKQNLTANASGGLTAMGIWRVRCWLPPASSAGNFNYIISYGMSVNQ